ncbi:MAG: TldD/PmbA family protein [Clostridia bacterium]|nr:TldD/PmbA family protein [Clostridia bacterium]
MLHDFLSACKSGFDPQTHSELRAQLNRNRRVILLSGNVVGNDRSDISGVSARVYRSGTYGFSSMADCSEESARRVLSAATENAAFMDRHVPAGKGPIAPMPYKCRRQEGDIHDPAQNTYIEFAKALDDYVVKHCPNLVARRIVAMEDSMEKMLVTSDGMDAHAIYPRSYCYVMMTAQTPAGTPVDLFKAMGGAGTFDINFTDPAACYDEIDKLYARLMEKREGVYADAGRKTVILDGMMTGMLSHEAVGHTVEADLVLGGSVAGPCLHKRVASDLVTLTDFAHTAFGEPCPLPVYVDDEGTEAIDAPLIENGILTGYMNSRETAQHFGMKPTGNARAWLFSDEPLIRMRNTSVHPGKDKLEDMIASIDEGYYLIDSGNGQADTTGEFMFGVTMGYEIKHGKLGRALLDTTISGVAFEMLKTVDMVGDKVIWVSSGMCGKKQPMPVGMGGPALRCQVMIGGR